MVVHGGRHLPEIKRRIAMTLASLAAHRTKIFANVNIDLPRRVSIFRSTAFATLTNNIGTWLQLTESEQKAWRTGVMKVYRKLLIKLFHHSYLFSLDDGHVLALTGLPHPDDLLHVERLRHFGLVLRRPNDVFWALVASEGTWLHLVKLSFDWLYSQIQGLTPFPDPRLSPEPWHECICQAPHRWKGILKRGLAHATGQRELATYAHLFHKDFFQVLEKVGLQSPGLPSPTIPDSHVCLICQRCFSTFRGWAVHSFDKHQRLNRYRQLDTGSTCKACGRNYNTNSRLVLHFRSSASCSATVAAQQLWPSPQPFMGSTAVTSSLVHDSMFPWIQTGQDILQPRGGTAMTVYHFNLMKLLATINWDALEDPSVAMEQIRQFLYAHPVRSA